MQYAKAVRPAKDAMCKAISLTKETQRRFAWIKTQYSRPFTLIYTQYARRFALQKILKAILLVNSTKFKAICLAVVTQDDQPCLKCALLRIQMSINAAIQCKFTLPLFASWRRGLCNCKFTKKFPVKLNLRLGTVSYVVFFLDLRESRNQQ